MLKQWKALIVDDERLARQQLRSMLSAHPEIQIVGEADDVRVAATAIDDLKPDVVFLDIQMPGASGFDLLSGMDVHCQVIFVTAFDEYAVRAFEVNALDYLLKPVRPERLATAIKRLSAPPHELEKKDVALEYDDHLFLSFGNGWRFLKVSAILCIRAAGAYSEILTSDGEKALCLKSLNQWVARLPGRQFMRIHRSTIVNVEYVERVDKWFNYSYQVRLCGVKEPLTMSRRYAARLKGKLK